MIRSILGRAFGHPIPYHSSANRRLVKFGRRDYLTINDVVTGTQIFGGTGSGKTSTSGRLLADAFLKSGFGGLVLCAKPDEAQRWQKIAHANGRAKDLVIFNDSGQYRFNWLDYAQATIAADGRDLNLIELVAIISEAAKAQASRGGGDGDNQFFRDAANQLMANAFPFLRKVYGSIRLKELYQFINSAPHSREEAHNPAWAEQSFCGRTIKRVLEAAQAGDEEAVRITNEHGEYWITEFASHGDRTRSSVVSTLTSTIYPFLSGTLNEIFCTGTNIVPEYARQGLIIVMDFPTRAHGRTGIIAQQIFKLLFQMAMESETVTRKTRPVFIWADECQFFMNAYDTDHLSVCRQQRVANVFITQDMPTYFAKMGTEYEAESLLNKFGTRIFHATTDQRTSVYAADIVGKMQHQTLSESLSYGASSNAGDSLGEREGSGSGGRGVNQSRQRSRSTFIDYEIPPHYFGKELRKPTKANGGKSDAVIITNGSLFRSTKKHYIKAEFKIR